MPAKSPNVSQTGSIADYISRFQRATANLSDWGDAALIAHFKKGLDDDIKDILIHREKPTNLEEMMDMSAGIGKRLEDRRLEKELGSIAQEASIAEYVSDFQTMISRFHQPRHEIILTYDFYHGLSDEIKDEFVHVERPKKLEAMIRLAISIGTRLEERAKER